MSLCDVRVIRNMNEKTRNAMKNVLKDISPSNVPIEKRWLYWSMRAYFSENDVYVPIEKNVCTSLTNTVLPVVTLKLLFYKVYNALILSEDKSVANLFKIVDRIYFNGFFGKYFKQNSIDVTFTSDYNYKNGVTGYCVKTSVGEKCVYTVAINLKKIHEFFKTEHVTFGVRCYNIQEFYIHTFLHELVHLIIHIFCPEFSTPSHSAMFKSICYTLFEHKTYKHNLFLSSKDVGFEDINELRQSGIEFAEWTNGKEKMLVKIVKYNRSRVEVIDEQGKRYLVRPEALIRRKSREFKVPEIIDRNYILKKGWKTISFKGRDGKVVRCNITKLNPSRVKCTVDGSGTWIVPYQMVLGE